jgi:phosphatidate cytidylyltransferase
VGLAILGVVLVFLDTLVLNAAIGLIVILAVLELLGATGLNKHRALVVMSLLIALTIPFARARYIQLFIMEILFVLILLFFLVLLRTHETLRVEQVAMAFFFSTFVPVFFSCAVYIRDDFGAVVGGFYLLLALGSAWLSDTGAYFCGRAFGKHKLAPQISPHKTVEGAIGGVIVCTICMLLLAKGYSVVMANFGYTLLIHYERLLLVVPVLSVIGILGDLSASIIKRQFGVKDFGHIMPGHGGVMDRFDSVLFTMPSTYLLVGQIFIVFVV